jgi:hypothetical protein
MMVLFPSFNKQLAQMVYVCAGVVQRRAWSERKTFLSPPPLLLFSALHIHQREREAAVAAAFMNKNFSLSSLSTLQFIFSNHYY